MDRRQLEEKQLAQSSCLEENRVNHEGRETKVVGTNAYPGGADPCCTSARHGAVCCFEARLADFFGFAIFTSRVAALFFINGWLLIG